MVINKVCVFCASSPKIDKVYFQAAYKLGKILAGNGTEINYGGGAVGLMGKLADSVMEYGGKITGIIPVFMNEMKWAHKNITNLVVVKDMHERKRMMIKDTDAIIALPGGIGTLEELAEVITLKQLGQYVKPVIILNTNGFYNDFILLLHRMIEEKFMHQIHQKIWQVVERAEEVIPAIMEASLWNKELMRFAAFEE
jgi:uncharacterized protein (TIGR00730 family)